MWSYVNFLIFAEVFNGKSQFFFFFWLCDTNVATNALHEQHLLAVEIGLPRAILLENFRKACWWWISAKGQRLPGDTVAF